MHCFFFCLTFNSVAANVRRSGFSPCRWKTIERDGQTLEDGLWILTVTLMAYLIFECAIVRRRSWLHSLISKLNNVIKKMTILKSNIYFFPERNGYCPETAGIGSSIHRDPECRRGANRSCMNGLVDNEHKSIRVVCILMLGCSSK